jgi:Glycosyl hydrolase family 79 C-terminal beta domain
VRVVLINDKASHGREVAIRGLGGAATLDRLAAPSLRAASDVTLGGQSFGSRTATGLLTGPSRIVTLHPVAGRYVFMLPAGSAAMVTFQPT